ncbi:HNH endonuclease [Methylophaga muralis]|uniref:HNH endonuclease n=1 Tax=Methylophaga muralis TaxID=291169 RepID=A0A1E3GW13_9GAMM|nr:HNH endonuclease [Methylophaga muralis]ODN68237.1 HNH endonuclease [Methylophaga muralis]
MATGNEIISYFEMCGREGTSLQRGMNFRLHGGHSVLLMSVQPNSPYQDAVLEDGAVLIYEGHDNARIPEVPNPKLVDQPEFLPSGNLTENGKFHKAAQDFKAGHKAPDLVRVYEKLRKGIWGYNGLFHLVDSWCESDGKREVFKFRLEAIEELSDNSSPVDSMFKATKHRRIIPTHVKLEVWKRDVGKCTICGSKDELHFDHILPYSKGGTSLKAENVQLLCARHNLQKSDRIE